MSKWIPFILIGAFILVLFIMPLLFRSPVQTSTTVEIPSSEKVCEITIKVADADAPISLEEYVVGVVAAEMPANFHPEALKAQAIAARTYVLQTTNYGESEIEPTVARQVYYDQTVRQNNWQSAYLENEQKIREAVKNTEGEVIVYNDELITAMFHSMSNGMTESAKNYSGNDLPYLQPVASTDFQYATNYEVTKTFTINEWNERLGVNWTLKQVDQLKLTRNNTGRVDTVSLQNKVWTGREFRTLLDLRSTDFNIDVSGETIIVTTEGFGHGVGMSQYGADAMAKQGSTAHQILNHYYKNTKIEKKSCLWK
ncbi:stage II sporulation protein D [Ureibacillus manganicus]|uniref:Stage II sporulation protein D n=1 Tax=Ureibacillus manganicus DSM 26584 TaxID=1384049 RepID=A0A0A3I5S3_9BACL|nr:stage II sporulation protein D [Ureibacillus manganicus]KGR80151.1 stage II sporulation protein D [Ureibacillus manganicus DSM 26584]